MAGENRPSVAAELYDEQYYTHCEGYEEFAGSGGQRASRRLARALELADVGPGMRVLDVGCGRGEVVLHCAAAGARAWGVDYSPAAARIARGAADQAGDEVAGRAGVQVANVKGLAFADGSFDRVLMLDLLEHLYPWELELALAEAARVLRAGGRLVVHTMPNRWYYRVGYPLYRLAGRLAGRRLPRNPRARSEYHLRMHVNEQDVWRLAAALRRAGFSARVWVENVTAGPPGRGRAGRLAGAIMALPGLRLVLCNDVLAVAEKRGPGGGRR